MAISGTVVTLLHCGLASVSFAQDAERDLTTSSLPRLTATGDWAGVRTTLQSAGVIVEANTTLDFSRVGSDSIIHRVAARNLSQVSVTQEC